MPPKNAPDIYHTCPGCQVRFRGPAHAKWCPRCRDRTKTVTVELGPDQLQGLKTLAAVRNTTPEEIMRVALTSLMGRPRIKRLTGAVQESVKSLWQSRKRAR